MEYEFNVLLNFPSKDTSFLKYPRYICSRKAFVCLMTKMSLSLKSYHFNF